MELTLNQASLPFPIYVTPFYYNDQPNNEIHFLVELHGGEALCCNWLTLEKTWGVTLIGGSPEELIEKVYWVIERSDIVELSREAVDVEEL